MRLSKRTILVLSMIISAVTEASFIWFADRIPMLTVEAARISSEQLFRVDLREQIPERVTPVPAEAAVVELASRPGSIMDLLKSGSDHIESPIHATAGMAEIPNLLERAAAEAIGRDYNFQPDETISKKVDAKILEIDQAVARESIDVTRRLVRPSPDRIVEEGSTPALRVPEDSFSGSADRFSPVTSTLLGESGDASAPRPGGAVPPYETVAMQIAPSEAKSPEVRIEQEIARAPIEKAVAELREERPYAFLDDLVDIKLDTYIPPGEKSGYFRLRVLPKKDGKVDVLPKDVTFVIDASSSIQQRKLDQTSKGIQQAIEQLRPEDRFNVVAFRDTPAMFQPGYVQATAENKAAAQKFLAGMQSQGETDIYKGILPVVQEAGREGYPGVVLVVSDGCPTTGIRDARTIINGLTVDNDLNHSIYAFGGGNTVDRYLLDLLAYRNKGEAQVVKNIPDISGGLPKFFQQLSEPLLVNLRVDLGRIGEDSLFPSVVPDFYREQPVTLYGRFDPQKDKEFFMRLSGRAGDKKKEVIFRQNLTDAGRGDKDIVRGWAFQKAYHLIGEISRQGETPELMQQLRDLNEKYNIRTSYNP